MILFIDRLINRIIALLVLITVFLSLYCLYDLFPIKEIIKVGETTNITEPIYNSNYNNKNIIGWLKIYNTIIDYPILQSNNNTDYLSLNYKNEYSNSGSIFLDYRNDKNLNDDFNIIYGHNMSYRIMFSELKYYKNKEYLNTHNKGKISLKNNEYNIDIILYKEVNESDDIPYNLYLYKRNYNKKIYKYLTNKKGNPNKMLVLSTCKKGRKNKRVIILAILSKI